MLTADEWSIVALHAHRMAPLVPLARLDWRWVAAVKVQRAARAMLARAGPLQPGDVVRVYSRAATVGPPLLRRHQLRLFPVLGRVGSTRGADHILYVKRPGFNTMLLVEQSKHRVRKKNDYRGSLLSPFFKPYVAHPLSADHPLSAMGVANPALRRAQALNLGSIGYAPMTSWLMAYTP